MVDFVLDFGNARVKYFDPRANFYGDFRHAIVALSENQWQKVVGRGKAPEGFLRVNGAPFVVGDNARRYLIAERPRGAARYEPTYYGVGLASALSESYNRSVRNITLFASHAPGDVKYARNLVAAARGVWQVENRNGTFEYNIVNVQTLDEPLCGFAHYVFTEKGEERKRNPLATAQTLVIDVGGYTVDVAAVDPGGAIDQLSLRSTRTGIIDMTQGFEQELRDNNATLFKTTGDIDIRRIESALMTKQYQFGKRMVDCRIEADAAINALVNEVYQIIEAAGGEGNFDYMLLTGGGSALIYDALEKVLTQSALLRAEPNHALLKYANVFGGAKIAAVMRLEGVL